MVDSLKHKTMVRRCHHLPVQSMNPWSYIVRRYQAKCQDHVVINLELRVKLDLEHWLLRFALIDVWVHVIPVEENSYSAMEAVLQPFINRS